MNVGTTESNQVVASAIQEISHIATLPEVTLKIIQLVEDPTSTAQDLHKVIAYDPALCSRLLKVVNSAFYGLPGQIGSINRAIVLLGLNAVKNIAIAASLAKLFRGGELSPNFSARDLWSHSVVAAAGSKMVADALKLGLPDEAFLAGLIHDIGIIVEMQYDRHKLIDVVDQLEVSSDGTPAKSMLDVEQQVFGATHQDFGAGLCDKWRFPKSFALVAGGHHDPLSLPSGNRTLACVVHLIDHMTAMQGIGFRLDIQNPAYGQDVLDELKLTQAQMQSISESLPKAIEEVESLLS
ncbi:MAG: HDOD domain-containing protein [Planctomycetota bacterium]|nr:HDOD domain-containing protein [Planctomycetota bacterium]